MAAGRGTRLGNQLSNTPKTLLRVGAKTILEHQMGMLKNAGIDKIVIVVGFKADKIVWFCAERSWDIDFVFNKDYASSDAFFSLWLARGHFRGGFVCIAADRLFTDEILGNLLGCGKDICAIVGSSTLELVKVRLGGGKIAEVNKTMRTWDSRWGAMMKFSQDGTMQLLNVFRGSPANQLKGLAFYEGAQRIVDSGYEVWAVDAGGHPWVNINTLEDLEYARDRKW